MDAEDFYRHAVRTATPWAPGSPGEQAIAADSEWAYYYARYVIGGPWRPGEVAIAGDPAWAYYYARYVIGGPWTPGEAAIKTDEAYWRDYQKVVLRARQQWLEWYASILPGRVVRIEKYGLVFRCNAARHRPHPADDPEHLYVETSDGRVYRLTSDMLHHAALLPEDCPVSRYDPRLRELSVLYLTYLRLRWWCISVWRRWVGYKQ